ncbi:MAG: MBL fold metallo-hydrolase [Synergistaceae bacterium]|nr:MBL fold metallo-hydrolase [Synergistaceae bacterium]
MNITMLGTGNALVTECYNTCFVLGEGFLVDTGGGSGILHQLRHAGFTLQDIHDVFITHSHIDHILGAVWLIRITAQMMHRDNYSGDLAIYSHNEVIPLLNDLAQKLLLPYQAEYLGPRIHLHTVRNGEARTISGQEFTFFDIHSERTKQYGFVMSYDGGKRLVCYGDEPCHASCEHYAENADWVLHESFCLHSDAETLKPYEKHHSTVKDAASLAQRLGVKNLLLYHTEDSDLQHRKERYTSEARQYFSGNVYVPDDLETLALL